MMQIDTLEPYWLGNNDAIMIYSMRSR